MPFVFIPMLKAPVRSVAASLVYRLRRNVHGLATRLHKIGVPRALRTGAFNIATILVSAMLLASCRGMKSTEPPILPVQNMVEQTSYGPQAPNDFFKDKRATREPVPNTVATGEARTDSRFFQGLEPTSTAEKPQWVTTIPLKLDTAVIAQGQKNFNIYCSPCHGLSGHNDGIVTKRSGGSILPAQIHDPKIIALAAGSIFNSITNGVNNWNMPGFRSQLNETERWAIVAYVRALQLSEKGALNDVPADVQLKKGWQKQ